jgi:hypothetical protein
MSDKDYKHGYDHGFQDGWNAAKKAIDKTLKNVNTVPYTFNQGCSVCGIGKNGEPLGVRCQHPQCPTRSYSINYEPNKV